MKTLSWRATAAIGILIAAGAPAFHAAHAQEHPARVGPAQPSDSPSKATVQQALDAAEKAIAQPAATGTERKPIEFHQVLTYLHEHPDDQEIHRRAVEVLKQFSNPRDPKTELKLAGSRWPSTPYAWAALQELGELKISMTRQQVEELLGPPDDLSANRFPFGNSLGGGGGGFGAGGGAHSADQAKTAAAKQSKDPEELQWTRPMLPAHENPLPAILKAQLKDGKTTAWKIQWPGEFRGKIPYGMPGAEPE